MLVTVISLVLYYAYPAYFGYHDNKITLVLALIGTFPLNLSLIESIRRKELTIDMLAGIALLASYIAGELSSVLLINLMIISAKILSEYTEQKTEIALNKLIKLRPTEAKRKINGTIEIVHISNVKVGDILIVVNGDKIPVDGKVIHGLASINQASLTGESIPIDKREGDKVFTSTIVESGEIEIIAEKVGAETSFEKIVQMVEKAATNRAKIDSFGQKFTKAYIIAVFLSAIIIYGFTQNFDIVLSLLLVVCADDIAIAIPLAYIAGIGQAAQNGIIIKGSAYLDELRNIKHIVLDKTGTITEGIPDVTDFIFIGNKYNPQLTLKFAGAASKLSKHPISQAVYNHALGKGDVFEPDDYEIINGAGVHATVNSKNIFLGSEKFMMSKHVTLNSDVVELVESERSKGQNVTLLAVNAELVAVICVADKVKENVHKSVKTLAELGVKEVTVLTGDNGAVAQRITSLAGIKSFHSDLLPEQKLKYINHYMKSNKVMMVGDGVNDTPSLVAANIGIAMGAIGSDVAIDSADIVLMDDNFAKIPIAIKLSQTVFKVAQSNIVIWGIVNAIGIVLVFTGHLPPSAAAAYNFATDFIPIFNSMRIFRKYP